MINEETTQVPFLDLKAQYPQIRDEINERFEDILANTGFILGKHVEEFEQGFAKLPDQVRHRPCENDGIMDIRRHI